MGYQLLIIKKGLFSLEKASRGTLSPFTRTFENCSKFVKTHSYHIVNTKTHKHAQIYRPTQVQTYTGLDQKDIIQKQSTVEDTNKHADMSQTYTHRHTDTHKHTHTQTANEQNEYSKAHNILLLENQLN